MSITRFSSFFLICALTPAILVSCFGFVAGAEARDNIIVSGPEVGETEAVGFSVIRGGDEGSSEAQWTLRAVRGGDERYRRLEYRNDIWHGSTYWAGPDWTRVGKDWHHPGQATPSVRSFSVPHDGTVTVSGKVYKGDVNNGGGDGVRLEIRHNARPVWTKEIEGDDKKGVEPDVTLSVRLGDTIRFVVHKRGAITYDTTHWDPIITYETGELFQASRGFDAHEQCAGGWFYEMEVGEGAKISEPTVRFFDADCALSEQALPEGTVVEWDQHKALPVFVVADAEGTHGLAMAIKGGGGWSLRCCREESEFVHVSIDAGEGAEPEMPTVHFAEYAGSWQEGMAKLDALLCSGEAQACAASIEAAFNGVLSGCGTKAPSLALKALIYEDWRRSDDEDSCADAAKRHLAKCRVVLDDLRREGRSPQFFEKAEVELASLAEQLERDDLSVKQWRRLYTRVRWLKREVVLANPLMDFERLLFCKRVPTSYSHLVMQYYGWRARPGGGLFVLENPGRSLEARDILAGQLSTGNVLEPRLSYDGRRIVFAYVEDAGREYKIEALDHETDEGFYHIYEVGVDGTGLRQLTSGPYDDLMPAYLPDGGIMFCSTRRKGYARCFGAQFSPRWDTYTLHRMEGDGSELRTISFNDVNEWFPTVANTGHVLYARWDYIDRDAVTHQNLWSTRPDGTNPATLWGNATASPHCAFQAQPIPRSNKIVFTASAHHSITAGSIVVLDPSKGVDGEHALTRITPEVAFPEAETRDIPEYYASPWPLSEKYFLVAFSPEPLVWEPGANGESALGIYLLDVFGNRELIYRDPAIGSTNPCPLRPRTRPPVLEGPLPKEALPTGTMALMDVYEGLGEVPQGSIKELRIVQIFPKTTPLANTPPIGLAREENARAILGTVPVEEDGSAHFEVPARVPILFQALDEDGNAYQTMRTITYVQPGERVSCVGCHENRMMTQAKRGKAFEREPSKIDPGLFGGEPFSFSRVVQPILEKHCVTCHDGEDPPKGKDLRGVPHDAFTKSYYSLCGGDDFWADKTNLENAAAALVPRFGGRNQVQVTPPGGGYGARGSRLMKMLRAGHKKVELRDDELRRIAAWIDCNAVFYGAYTPERQARELRAEAIPMPEIQ